QDATVAHGEAAVVANPHGAHLVTDVAMLALKPGSLMEVELAFAEAVRNALLLVELTLGERGVWRCLLRGRGRGLGDGEGGRRNERRHKCELRDSHGVILLLWRPVSCVVDLTTHTQ